MAMNVQKYNNATTESIGTPNTKLSPLIGFYSATNLLNILEKVFKTIIYEVTVNTKTSISSFIQDIDQVPANTFPPWSGSSWHIKDKQANTVYDSKGAVWLQINIKWEKLPVELRDIGFTGWK